MTPVSERFLKYVAFDTQSFEESETCPTNEELMIARDTAELVKAAQ